MFDLAKRLGRLGFFGYWLLAVCIVTAATYPAYVMISDAGPGMELLVKMLAAALGYLMVLPLGIRRLHDIGWTGWLVLLLFVPYVFAVLALILFFWPGTKGENRFGPDPRVRATANA
jgi:uncharacterized membrane protein YhaH (DUF805 family)